MRYVYSFCINELLSNLILENMKFKNRIRKFLYCQDMFGLSSVDLRFRLTVADPEPFVRRWH